MPTTMVFLAGCGTDKPAGGDGRGDGDATGCGVVPASFAWTSTGPILTPKSDATHSLVSIKDPSIVRHHDQWHVFVSTVDAAGSYSMAQVTFPDWDHVADASFTYLDQVPALRGYHAAPEVFYFQPQKKWYLVFQSGPPQYSTNDDLENPAGWTSPQNFYVSEPTTLKETKGATGGWLDFWVICDDASCYLFFSDDNGHFYRAQTKVSAFPQGFGEPVVVLRDDTTPSRLFEASNVYKIAGSNTFLATVEGFDQSSGYQRYFRSWSADRLDGDWTPLADTFAAPFASTANVTFPEQPGWTPDISHGEMLRSGADQHLGIDTCHLQFLYQGLEPQPANTPYNSLPWKLGLLTSTVTTDMGGTAAGGQ